ncbi:hypothetical protein ElyMa_002000100 [Elysia marginata]|uniref:Uncharacterized protein n=1 Tax=Elysia marginata TaxID=1093978 RepID=A0AAV4F518_9GAST|nr:hypothetical protein ElyMa_002000100 [Elysia marginata]
MAAGNPVFLLCPQSTQQLQFSIGIPNINTPDSLYGEDFVPPSHVPFLTSSLTSSSSSFSSSSSSSTNTPDQESVALPGSGIAAETLLVPPVGLSISTNEAYHQQLASNLPIVTAADCTDFLAQPDVGSTSRHSGTDHCTQKALSVAATCMRSGRRPDNVMFTRPDAVTNAAITTRSASRRAKLSRAKRKDVAIGFTSQTQAQQCSFIPPVRQTAAITRPSSLSLPTQKFPPSPAADSFSRRLLAGAVEAAQHLEETMSHVSGASGDRSYLQMPMNYELYLASSSPRKSTCPPVSNGSVSSLRAQEYLPRIAAQSSQPLPPLSVLCGISRKERQRRNNFVYDTSVNQNSTKNLSHIQRSPMGRNVPSDKFPYNNSVSSTHGTAYDEVIVIDDEPDRVSCDDATPNLADSAASQYLVSYPQSTSTFSNTSHKPTLNSYQNTSSDSIDLKSIDSHKPYLFSVGIADETLSIKSSCDRPKNSLQVAPKASIFNGCVLEIQGKPDPQLNPSEKVQKRVTESGFNFSPAYLKSRRTGVDLGILDPGRNAGVSLDSTLESQLDGKPVYPHIHTFGESMAKPHYSSDDVLATSSVFVFPSNAHDVQILNDGGVAQHQDLQTSHVSTELPKHVKVRSPKSYRKAHSPGFTPFSPPGKPPPISKADRSMDDLQTVHLSVSADGSVCPRAQKEDYVYHRGQINNVDWPPQGELKIASSILSWGNFSHYCSLDQPVYKLKVYASLCFCIHRPHLACPTYGAFMV